MTEMVRPDEVAAAPSLCAVFQQTVRERPDAIAVRALDDSPGITWRGYAERVRRIAAGLAALGVRRGDAVALMMTNRPEFSLVDMAVVHLGATPFSVYNTSSPAQIDHLFSKAGNDVVICEAQFLDRLRPVAEQRGIERLVCVEGGPAGVTGLDEVEASGREDFDFEAAWRAVGRDDVATLIFTSGTTGEPKAVEITHGNILYAVSSILRTPEVLGREPVGGTMLSYLPDAHMANRMFAHYVPVATGATVVTIQDARALAQALPQVRPTLFAAVPMVWYRLKAAVERAVSGEVGERRAAMTAALEVGLEKVRQEAAGMVTEDVRARYAEADRSVLAPLRARLGLDRVVAGISGGAPIAPEAIEFIMALGLPVLEGWAMSETSGAGILNPPDRIKPGTVGRPRPGTEIRVGDDGELLVRGPGVMKGYRNDPEATASTVDADGWLHTGDVVTVDAEGYVTVVDRKKELIINSAGKNMSPAGIENAVKTACPLVGSVVAIGDRRPYVVALLTLDPDAATGFAASHGLAPTAEALAGEARVLAEVRAGIERANASLSRPEQIRAFTILPTFWLPNSDELTPTLKVKRRVVGAKYAAEIEEIYNRPDERG